jgi:membrane protease subunit (stomatin/prohibitin family)
MTESAGTSPQEHPPDDSPPDAIDRVRDLLFGEVKREHDNRIAELGHSMRAMHSRIDEQLRSLEAKMEAMSQALSSRHEENLRQIGEAIESVGRQISALANSYNHDHNHKA